VASWDTVPVTRWAVGDRIQSGQVRRGDDMERMPPEQRQACEPSPSVMVRNASSRERLARCTDVTAMRAVTSAWTRSLDGTSGAATMFHAHRVALDLPVDRRTEPGEVQGLVQSGWWPGTPCHGPKESEVGDAGQVRYVRRAVDEDADAGQHGGAQAYRLAEDPGAAGVRGGQADQRAHRGGLTRPVRAERRADLAGLDGQAEPAHRLRASVPFGQLTGADHRRFHRMLS
jgi:hypothetical protein